MATPTRRGRLLAIGINQTLVAADDLTGTAGTRRSVDVAGATRVLVVQDNVGTAGTAGIDVVLLSKDGGTIWTAATDVLAVTSDDSTGTVLVGGALNAAGVEPTTVETSTFKCGPYEGPTLLRIGRKTATSGGTTWVTGAPRVYAIVIGQTSGAPTTITHTAD